MTSGMQPPAGFTPSRLYSAAISAFISWRLGSRMGYFLYFSWMAFICGCSFCIFSADFMLVMRSGSSARLMTIVRMMMATPQLLAMCSWVHFSHRNSGRAIRLKKPKFTTSRQIGAVHLSRQRYWSDRLQNSSALGPTNRRSRVTPSASADRRTQHFVAVHVVRIGLAWCPSGR